MGKQEFKYFYDGRGFYDLVGVARAAKVNYNSLVSRINRGSSIEESVRLVRETAKAKAQALEEAKKYLGKEFSTYSEIKGYLDENDYPYNQAYLKSTYKRMEFIKLLSDKGYADLLKQTGEVEFNSISFTGFSGIARAFGFYIGDLYRAAFEYEGDMLAAFNFLVTGGTYFNSNNIEFDGNNYSSLYQLCKEFGISTNSVGIRVRKGMPLELAIRNSIEAKNKIRRMREQYPLTVNGVHFTGNKDVRDYFDLSDHAYDKYLYNSDRIEDGINQLFNRISYKRMLKEFGWTTKYYNISIPQLTRLAKEFNTVAKLVKYLDSIRFEFKGEYHVALEKQLVELGFSTDLPIEKFQRALRITTPGESRQRVVERYANKYLECVSI